jgi:hypothetical protein
VRSKNYGAPHNVVFSNLSSLPLSSAQILIHFLFVLKDDPTKEQNMWSDGVAIKTSFLWRAFPEISRSSRLLFVPSEQCIARASKHIIIPSKRNAADLIVIKTVALLNT